MKLQAKLKPGYEHKAKKVHIGLIKAECIKYAANNDMKVIELTDEVFKATGTNCMIHIDLLNVYIKVSHGWTVEEGVGSRTSYKFKGAIVQEEVKFKDIKVGDEVLIEKSISYGWRSDLRFWVKTKVSKVTAAQFEIDLYPGVKYKKSNGGIVKQDSWACVKREGDYDSSSKTVQDQTKEYLETKEKFSLYKSIGEEFQKLEKIDVPTKLKKDKVKLEALLKAIKDLYE